MREIRLAPPAVEGNVARFAWTVQPETELYRRTGFELRFPEDLDLHAVGDAVWWRVALVCLHAHWARLRPCRVVLPVTLAPGERELWLRLCDALVVSLEARRGDGRDTRRAIDIVEAGPELPAPAPVSPSDVVASCFSGGRDSLTQAALLQELGLSPVLVTVTSPREGSVEHETRRRRDVMDEMVRRRGLELIEVGSDYRAIVDNGFGGERYGTAVSETTDTHLFFAAALVVATARGASRVCVASEAEVQAIRREGGEIVQDRHAMYSAVTQSALTALLAPAGIRYESLTYPLFQFQVQRLLAQRYGDLRDLQYSCWELAADETACSRCDECRSIGFNLLAEGVSPSAAGIDLAAMLLASDGWRPTPPDAPASFGRRGREAQILRCLDIVPPSRIAELLGPGDGDALRAYERLHAALRDQPREPEPGYRAGYLEFTDEALRAPLDAIFGEHFAAAAPETYAAMLGEARTLAAWISAPLTEVPPRPPAPERPRPVVARPPDPPPPDPALLAAIAPGIPGPEPVLVDVPGLRTLRVAETVLDGNELRYVTECIEGNWVSSAGRFVAEFEAAFAAVAGTRYAIASSSGTTALHLALAGAGIGRGDEVIVPTFTMIATANAVGYTGATPVFVDTDRATWNLDLDQVVDAIGPRTRAIVVVHTYGEPVDMDAVRAIADANDLLVVEDAAEAHGASYGGRAVGSLGDVAAFSFYGNKIVTTGEGGMVTTNDPAIAAAARELRDHGFSPERHFWHRLRAFNYRMSNLQAAVGLAQVERLDALIEGRREVARAYRDRLAGVPGVTLAPVGAGGEGVPWMFGILVGDELGRTRDELRHHLAAQGIETRTFFVPLHRQPSYLVEQAGRRFPVAEDLGERGLYLPSAPTLEEADIERVAGAIRAAQPAGMSPSSA